MKNIITLFLILILISCSSNEIVNLRTAKDIVKEYYESGKYDREMDGVIKEAKEKFDKIEINNNSAVIFDVDDTALSNYEISLVDEIIKKLGDKTAKFLTNKTHKEQPYLLTSKNSIISYRLAERLGGRKVLDG